MFENEKIADLFTDMLAVMKYAIFTVAKHHPSFLKCVGERRGIVRWSTIMQSVYSNIALTITTKLPPLCSQRL